ncbi:unnamed protein product [Lepeophtheirus salmonis]|uniref:(salmon louse) hypothetical protein n=1 Tax=Lepeophtheirus salmonis TaxID=72036 RepID=A0A7R8HAA9_LEPSM|nr:unnamed protein product [Lepeophtheirus salmonis]CAF2973214.1 unnamed protein product [Lepeophtheirus salmonis]
MQDLIYSNGESTIALEKSQWSDYPHGKCIFLRILRHERGQDIPMKENQERLQVRKNQERLQVRKNQERLQVRKNQERLQVRKNQQSPYGLQPNTSGDLSGIKVTKGDLPASGEYYPSIIRIDIHFGGTFSKIIQFNFTIINKVFYLQKCQKGIVFDDLIFIAYKGAAKPIVRQIVVRILDNNKMVALEGDSTFPTLDRAMPLCMAKESANRSLSKISNTQTQHVQERRRSRSLGRSKILLDCSSSNPDGSKQIFSWIYQEGSDTAWNPRSILNIKYFSVFLEVYATWYKEDPEKDEAKIVFRIS